jgi:predicted N-acetyltransferase YhbS
LGSKNFNPLHHWEKGGFMNIQEIASFDTQRIQELNVLISEAFGYPRPHHFLDDFPIWASPLSKVVRLGAIEGTKLIAHVGIRYAEMRTVKGSEKVALIGAVATAKEHRGRGVSSALMTEALKRVDARGCTWSLLWGSEHEFYSKFGFTLSGNQARAQVDRLAISKVVPVSEIKMGMNEKIFQSILSEKNGIKLGEEDRAWIFAHKTIQWLSLDAPFAFVGFQRGMDMQHIVHSFGGDAEKIQSLLYAIFTKDELAECLGTAESLTKLGFDSTGMIKEALCLARSRGVNGNGNASSTTTLATDAWVNGISAC